MGQKIISVEQYQKFHDAARDSGGYAVRGYGLGISWSIMVLVGGSMLLFLKGAGAKLAVGGCDAGHGIRHFGQPSGQRCGRCTFDWRLIAHL